MSTYAKVRSPREWATPTIYYKNILSEKIKNLSNVPKCYGANYLSCFKSHNGEYIASNWHRKEPKTLKNGYVLLSFIEAEEK